MATTDSKAKILESDIFPAGRYWVGDLGYVIEDWATWLVPVIQGNQILDGTFPWRGKHTWHSTTSCGDGIFEGTDGNAYYVDAGLIGIIPADLVDEEHDGGCFHTFRKPFTCRYQAGKFTFGEKFSIQTDPFAKRRKT